MEPTKTTDARESDTRVAYDAGKAIVNTVITQDGLGYLVAHKDLQIINLPDFRTAPTRKTGEILTHGIKDFIALVKREKGPNTIILCEFVHGSEVSGSARALIDYHAASSVGAPSWCGYSVVLSLTPTPEWKAWNALFNKATPQLDFAEFLEEHHTDISRPSGAEVLEVALTLQARKDVQFETATRLQNRDTKLVFVENTKTTAGAKGDMEVPTEITLDIPPYEGFGLQNIKCMLRFKIYDGKLTFTVKPMNLPKVLRATRDQVVDAIESATGIMVADGVFKKGERS